MKPTFIGFNGPTPYAIIIWNGKCKTICYDKQELEKALARHNTPGDYYNTLEPSIYIVEGDEGDKLTA